jgi:hypothetical protein
LPRRDRPAGSSIENHHITMKIKPVMLSMGHGWVGPPLIAFSGRLALARQVARASALVFLTRPPARPAAG